ncbi:AMP-binding protein, partial [Burkholderia pseudomallei]|nr:AMP-binding protein [Burkholderia pseudomallei]
LTYGELARATDALGHMLVEHGVTPGDRVALAVGERAMQTRLALAILKVGAAYVPVDLANPPERLAYLLDDCGAKLVLTTRDDRPRLPATGANVVCADALDDAAAARHAGRPLPRVAIAAGQPAYCIYTSGSTGQPKGVLVTHGGLANLVDWHVDAFALDAGARAAMLAGPGFDAAVWEIWPALCAGASLAEPAPDARHDVAELARWLDAHAISHCFMPTPLAEAFIAAAARPRAMRGARMQ